MLKFLKKAELWESIDMGFVPKNPVIYHLKYAQDVMALRLVGKEGGRIIGEIGADHSRVLPDLVAAGNDAYAIDIYTRSVGGGKTQPPIDVPYKFFNCLVGQVGSETIPDSFFDVTFSVSVVEHVTDLPGFFEDNIRITKPGGLIIHMIDIYMNDLGIAFQPTLAKECIAFLKRPDIQPLTNEVMGMDGFKFSTRLATNGDDMMYRWNKQVPSLMQVREESAVCNLMVGALVRK